MEFDKDGITLDWENILKGEEYKICQEEKQIIIEYTSKQCNALRVICYDQKNNSFFMYTFDTSFTLVDSEAEKLLLYTNALNDILINTLIEFDMKDFQFRYKSGQCFPPGVSLEKLIVKLIGVHDRHFEVIKNILSSISSTTKNLSEFCERSLKALNKLKSS